ncbi:MAG: hypothetical protein ABL940_00505 [Bacteroidia bacterium]
MKEMLKTISLFIVISAIVVIGCVYLKSNFLFDYLKDNLISLLLTLLAINTATLGLIASKIQDVISIHPNFNFSNTIEQMKRSLLEQVVLIILTVLTLVMQDSRIILFSHKTECSNLILTFVLIYSIDILYDTGNSVFVIIEELQELNRKEK